MPRRRRNLPLWLRLFVRRLQSPEGKLAPLAVISIAVSVTLATGLEMASRSAQRQMELSAEAMIGSAQIEIVAGQVGVPEAVLDTVRQMPGVRAASPLVSVKLRLVDSDFALNVVGVDLAAEEQVRPATVERAGLKIRDPLRLLATPNAVVVTQELLDRLSLSEQWSRGERTEIHVRSSNSSLETLSVQGVLDAGGIAAAFGGQIALMDVYSAQELSKRAGLFDRIDIVPSPDQSLESLIASLSVQLAGVATARRASGHRQWADDLLLVVRRAAVLFSGAGVLVACLLTFATTTQWVDRQRRQLATLRAVGMEADRVQRMVFVEVAAISILGTLLGVAGGVLLSPLILASVSDLLMRTGIEQVANVVLRPSTLIVALVVGIIAGSTGSISPARRAGHRFTLDSLEQVVSTAGYRRRWFAIGTIALAIFAITAVVGPLRSNGSAMRRLAVLIIAGPVAILAFSSMLLNLVHSVIRPLRKTSPALGHLGLRLFASRPHSFGIALTSIATLVGSLISVFLMISTITHAMVRWSEARYPDATLVTSTPLANVSREELLTPATIELIANTSGVAAIDEQYKNGPTVIFRGKTVRLAALSAAVVASHGHIAAVGRESSELATDLSRGAVAVSTGFAMTFGIAQGDVVELDTSRGPANFLAAGVYEDFGDATGSILMDINTFDRHWKRAGAWGAAIWVDGDRDSVLEAIRSRVGTSQDLYFTGANEIAASNRAAGEVFTSVLRVLGGFLSSLGGIAVTILLVGVVAEQRRHLAVLRASGAEPSQLVRLVLLEAFAIGTLGAVCGAALGFASATTTADVLRETYGWILEQRWFAAEVPIVFFGAVLAACVGGLAPARMAYRTPPVEVFAPE